jgi:hypothetical protein
MGLLASSDDDKKPLFRTWYKQALKNGSDKTNLQDIVISIKLSSSEEWIIIEGKSCVCLISAESKAGVKFWEFATQLTGKLNCLLIKYAKNKLGFDIEIDTTQQTTWYQDENDKVTNDFFLAFNGSVKETDSFKGLTMAKMKRGVTT